MPKRVRPPSEKKRLSYERDGRNTYGENSKASRKAIPRFKSASNRAMRHNTKQIVSAVGLCEEASLDVVDKLLADKTFEGLHPSKRKMSDQPLGKTIVRKKEKRATAPDDKALRHAAIEDFRLREGENYQRHLENLERRRVARHVRRKTAQRAKKVAPQ